MLRKAWKEGMTMEASTTNRMSKDENKSARPKTKKTPCKPPSKDSEAMRAKKARCGK